MTLDQVKQNPKKYTVSFSDRYTAKKSGTTRQGNSGVKVWDSIRKDGLVPEMDWPFPFLQRDPVFTWEDYYMDIPEDLNQLGKQFLDHFKISYEWVFLNASFSPAEEIKKRLKQAPLQIFAPVCSPWNTDKLIPSCPIKVPQHATTVYSFDDGERFYDFDHYSPYRKQLAWDYPILYVLKGVIQEIKPVVPDNSSKLYAMEVLKSLEGEIVQDSEQSGAFALVKNGELLVADPSRVAELVATKLAKGLPKEVWNNALKDKF